MKKPRKTEPRKSAPRPSRAAKSAAIAASPPDQAPSAAEDQIYASDLTLHDLFQQQTARMLERADLTEDQKQSLLIGMACPCCGAGGFSFTAKLRRG
jgi:hypothetical protein